jgi:hypothetical protein
MNAIGLPPARHASSPETGAQDGVVGRIPRDQRPIAIDQPALARTAIADTLRNLDYLTHRSVPVHQPIPWI